MNRLMVTTSLAALAVIPMGQAQLLTISCDDPDTVTSFNSITYSLGGADAGDFTINPTSGQVTAVVPLDFEAPADDNQDNRYALRGICTDGTFTDAQDFEIVVQDDANDNLPVVQGKGANGRHSQSVAENTSLQVNFVASVTGGTAHWSIAGGADRSHFTMVSNGQLSFAAKDFESAQDANDDNTYEVLLSVAGPGGGVNVDVTITVMNVDEDPVLATIGTQSIDENEVAVIFTPSATDPERAELGFSLTGPDAANFTMLSTTGVVTPKGLGFDFENASDANDDGIHEITVTVSDGANSVSEDIQVTVADVNEPVVMTNIPAEIFITEQ